MKKIGLPVLVSMALLLLGVVSCASYPKLDLSTLDPSQPVDVYGIFMYITVDNVEFYQKYGESLRTTGDQLASADADKLLKILCGTVAGNWESIVESVKAKTGLVLNGDQFMQNLEDGVSKNISSQLNKDSFGRPITYFYSWNGDIDSQPNTAAMIGLLFDGFSGIIEVNKFIIETADVDAFDERTNVRQITINF
jgi:hypothetical protein